MVNSCSALSEWSHLFADIIEYWPYLSLPHQHRNNIILLCSNGEDGVIVTIVSPADKDSADGTIVASSATSA